MSIAESPRWLRFLERKCSWLAIPNIGILFVTLQALGYFMVMNDPVWVERLALLPNQVTSGGEYWRLITFLALPISDSPIWLLFSLWFLYFILGEIEQIWGSFKTTFYLLVSIVLTIFVSFLLNYPVTQVTDFSSTLFLAAAALFPEFEVRLFFVIPVKMKWLGWMTLLFLGFRFFQTDVYGKLYLTAIYSNYLLFFGPELLNRLKYAWRRRRFK